MNSRLLSIPLAGRLLAFLHLHYVGWRFSPTRLITNALGGRTDVSVVVIGANDGPTTDPSFPLLQKNPGWHGVFVEPVPYLFEKLRRNYGDSGRFTFVNAAVSSSGGASPFYFVSPDARASDPSLPSWVEQLGSFDRNHIAVQLGGRLQPFILEISVPTITLEELFSRTPQKRADLLVIDTEGHDWKILRQLDLSRWKPSVIVFENCAISDEDKRAARAFLEPHYLVRDIGKDYFCTLRH